MVTPLRTRSPLLIVPCGKLSCASSLSLSGTDTFSLSSVSLVRPRSVHHVFCAPLLFPFDSESIFASSIARIFAAVLENGRSVLSLSLDSGARLPMPARRLTRCLPPLHKRTRLLFGFSSPTHAGMTSSGHCALVYPTLHIHGSLRRSACALRPGHIQLPRAATSSWLRIEQLPASNASLGRAL
jgi:hypothetical protein